MDPRIVDKRKRRYVAVSGAVGCGATTLADLLHSRLGWEQFEEVQTHLANEFFVDAFHDFDRWGFHSQAHFLTASAEQHAQLAQKLRNDGPARLPIVEDRTPFEHADAYLEAFRINDRLPARELRLLKRLAARLVPSFQVPDLMVFRRINHDEMVLRIRARNRPGEIDATTDFFEHIRVSFDHMIDTWRRSPVLVLDATVDLSDPMTADHVVATVSAALDGEGGPSRPTRRR